ncbi:MAG: hypothetical protein RL318_857 [Fibrobacterota bacterium]|jgi:holin-like protein
MSTGKAGSFLEGMLVLTGFQLMGELLRRLLHLPIPSPVLGMFLLLLLLLWLGRVPAGLARAADGLLGHLALLFVPAGVSAMLDIGAIRTELVAILLAVVASTWASMGVSAWTLLGLERLWNPKP